MSARAPLPVVELDPDSYAMFREFSLATDAGPVAVAPHLLRLAADAASAAARSGPPDERELAAESVVIFRRALRRTWRGRYGWDSQVILPPAAAALVAAGLGGELVLVRHSTVIWACWHLQREPAAAGWIEDLSRLVESWLRVFASGDEEARG